MIRALCLVHMVTALTAVAALPVGAQLAPEADRAEPARLAESVVRRAEEASGRAFDPAFRETARRLLGELPTAELASRESTAATRGLGPLTLGDSSRQLIYTPVAPCRIVDTRVAGGSLAAGAPRDFRVTGTGLQGQGGSPAGCNVPIGPATSVIINFVAVNPVGPGNLRAWAYTEPALAPPNASIVNYTSVPGLNIANGIAVPTCDATTTTCSFDLKVQADGNGTQLVADVVGYFERFPREAVRSFTATRVRSGSETLLQATCTTVPNAQVTLNAPVAGKVVVRGMVPVSVGHSVGVSDVLVAGIALSSSDCALTAQPVTHLRIPDSAASGVYEDVLSVMGVFDVAAGTHTFYLNGYSFSGCCDERLLGQSAGLEATFHPN